MDLRVKKRLLYKRQELVYRRVRRVAQVKESFHSESRILTTEYCSIIFKPQTSN